MNRLEKRSKASSGRQFTVRMKQDDGWWVGIVEEVPGVVSQGKTQEELICNLKGALEDMLEVLHEDATQAFGSRHRQELISV